MSLHDDVIGFRDGTDKVQDSECVVICVRGEPRIWLDIDRGFVVKKFVQPTKIGDLSRKEIVNEAFQRLDSSHWLVTKARIRYFGYPLDTPANQDEVLLSETVFTFTNLKINHEIPDSVFEISYPKGTRVVDKSVDKEAPVCYVVGHGDLNAAIEESLRDYEAMEKGSGP